MYLSLPPWSSILLMTDITEPAFTLFLPQPESNLQSRQVKHPFTTNQLMNFVCNQIPTFVTLEIKILNPFVQEANLVSPSMDKPTRLNKSCCFEHQEPIGVKPARLSLVIRTQIVLWWLLQSKGKPFSKRSMTRLPMSAQRKKYTL